MGREGHLMKDVSSHFTDEETEGQGGGGERWRSVQGAWGHQPASPTDRQHLTSPHSPVTRVQAHRGCPSAPRPPRQGWDGQLSPGGMDLVSLDAPLPRDQSLGTRTPAPLLFPGSTPACCSTCLCEAQAAQRVCTPGAHPLPSQPGLPAGRQLRP